MYRNTYVEINVDNLKSNIENIVKNYNYKYYIGVVKGNCYGHGYGVVNDMIKSGINYLAVSNLDEALKVRKENENIPILCLQPIDINYIDICIDKKITVTVSSYDYYLSLVKKVKSNLKFHLKINTGMNRLGINNKDEINKIYNSDNKFVELEGIYTHFMTFGISDKKWDDQLNNFVKLTEDINLEKIKVVHLGRSATLINHAKINFANGIRLGILMFGINQTTNSGKGIKNYLRKLRQDFKIKLNRVSPTITTMQFELKETFNVFSEIIEIKSVLANEYIGYGLSCKTNKNIKIGIADIGYYDGISLSELNRKVEINNQLYPILGINMGMIIIEIDKSVNNKDKVTIVGNQVNIKYVARNAGTTVYKVFTSYDSLPKKYKKKV